MSTSHKTGEFIKGESYLELRYKIFFVFWAIATLFHMAHFKIFDDRLQYFLLAGSAVFLLAKPSSTFRMVIFICLQLYESLSRLPIISNHWVFTAFVNLAILHGLIFLIIKNKSFYINKGELFRTFAPIARIGLLVLYFYVVFHKLNSSFFNPKVSCASVFYNAQNAYSILPADLVIISLNAYLTVIIEALIPIMLCFRKTRNIGILIGLVFHCIIAFNPLRGFYDFSSMIFAMYYLFSDARFTLKLSAVWKSISGKIHEVKMKLLKFSFPNLMAICALFLFGFFILNRLIINFPDFFRHIFWSIYSIAFIVVFLLSIFNNQNTISEKSHIFRISHLSFILLPVLLFLNGFSPYLGLKTEYSFAMFSNLRTEGGISNHYLISTNWQIFGFQKELVEIAFSSDPGLQELANNKKAMVYFAFKDYVAHVKPERVDYFRNGTKESFTLAEAPKNHELLRPNPYLLRKFLDFRPINKNEPQNCVH